MWTQDAQGQDISWLLDMSCSDSSAFTDSETSSNNGFDFDLSDPERGLAAYKIACKNFSSFMHVCICSCRMSLIFLKLSLQDLARPARTLLQEPCSIKYTARNFLQDIFYRMKPICKKYFACSKCIYMLH